MNLPRSKCASAQAILDLSIAVIDLYFRIEAATDAIVGFAQAGGEFGLLRSLVTSGPQTVPEMARARPISRQHCQTIANRLEAQGLVEFVANPKHRRSQLARVTKKGRARYEDLTKRFLAASSMVAAQFQEREVTGATDVLRRAHEVLGH